MDTKLHPTPQFARQGWIDLGGAWDFQFDDDNTGLEQGWECRSDPYEQTIQVPFPPESPASGIHAQGQHPVLWYRKRIQVQPAPGRARLLLHFGAVDYLAAVWVNGQKVAEHRGGSTPFSCDITRALIPNAPEQVIVVRAEDQPLDLTQPRGKQDWQDQPHAIWYHRTSGIWQPVWLERVSADRIQSLRWTANIHRTSLELALRLNRKPSAPLALRVRLSLGGQILAEDTYRLRSEELTREICLDAGSLVMDRHKLLWGPDHPNLIDAELTLLDGQTVLDQVSSYAGLRTVGLENGRFLLNGNPYYLRLVLEQGYWPESCLAAPSEAALRREVELIKELGFNGARIHQKVEDPRFLYWCDKLGLFVWGEMANAYRYSPEAAARFIDEWIEVLQRDSSHPAIVAWVPINESWGTPDLPADPRQRHFLQAVYALTKAIDPTRPVIDNDGWEHVQTDILSLHDYARSGETLLRRYGTLEAVRNSLDRGRPIGARFALQGYSLPDDAVIMLTEFGGISYKPEAGSPWFGYGTVSSEEEYLAALDELVKAALACRALSGFCYTQLTDTEQETNGLLTADRRPKFPAEAIRAILQTPRVV